MATLENFLQDNRAVIYIGSPLLEAKGYLEGIEESFTPIPSHHPNKVIDEWNFSRFEVTVLVENDQIDNLMWVKENMEKRVGIRFNTPLFHELHKFTWKIDSMFIKDNGVIVTLVGRINEK